MVHWMCPADGSKLGNELGIPDGTLLGAKLGIKERRLVGPALGEALGSTEDDAVGDPLGESVGDDVNAAHLQVSIIGEIIGHCSAVMAPFNPKFSKAAHEISPTTGRLSI